MKEVRKVTLEGTPFVEVAMSVGSAGRLLAKAVLSINGASVIRGLRSGPRAALVAMQEGYHAADPFSTAHNREELLLLRRIPEVDAAEAYGWPEEIVLDLRFADISGSTPIRDLLSFVALAVQQQPEAALEFGTFFGSTTVNLAKNLPHARIHTIDLPPDDEAARALIEGKPVDDVHLIENRQLGKAFRHSAERERIVQHAGDTATYDYSVIGDRVSYFLVDGSHTYEYAMSDSLVSMRLARVPSTIVWHDCDGTHPGVTRWLGELLDAGLPVRRIAGTAVAYLKFDPADERVKAVVRR